MNKWIRIYGTDIVERYSIEEVKPEPKEGKEMEAKMRAIQKVIIIVYCVVVAVACIYVPWVSLWTSGTSNFGLPISLGYSLLWEPLTFHEGVPNLSTVDIKRVILELVAITAVFAILFVLTLRHRQKEE